MSRLGGTQVVATELVKRVATIAIAITTTTIITTITPITTISACATATTAAAVAVVVAGVANVDFAAVLDYASAARRCKLAVDTVQLDEIDVIRRDKIIMTDTAAPAATDTQKRANFSALTVSNPNGVNKISPSLVNAKPGSAKKLVIKNFKSKRKYAALVST